MIKQAYLDFANLATMPACVACSRSGSAWYFNNGLLVEAAANTPRLSNGVGLLREGASTNLILHSRNLTDAAYDNPGIITITQDQVGIDGVSNTASLLEFVSTDVVWQKVTISSNTYVMSCFIKKDVSNTDPVYLSIDASTDILINATTEWQRFSVVATMANPYFQIKAGGSVLVDCVQIEVGTMPSTPIITNGAAVTRNPDTLTIDWETFNNNRNIYSPTQGTWIINVLANELKGTQCLLYADNNTATGDYITIGIKRTSTRLQYNAGYNQDYYYELNDTDLETNMQLQRNVVLATNYGNKQYACINGSLPVLPATVQNQTVNYTSLQKLWLGATAAGTENFNGYIKVLQYLPYMADNLTFLTTNNKSAIETII